MRVLALLSLIVLAACGGEPTAPVVLSVSVFGSIPITEAGASVGDSVHVRVTDASGNPRAGIPVSFAVTAGGGSISPTNAKTDAQGVASARFTTGTTVGVNVATAAIANAAPATFTITTIAGQAKTLSIKERIILLDAGQRALPSIVATDANGNAVPATQLSFSARTPTVVSVATDGTLFGNSLSQTFVVASSALASDSVLVVVTTPNGPVLQTDLSRLDVAHDTTFTVPIIFDMRSTDRLGATTIAIRWDPAQLTLVSQGDGASNVGALVNATGVSQGVLTLGVASASGFGGRVELRRLTFRAAATSGQTGSLRLSTSEVYAAGTFTDLLSRTTAITYPLSIR